MTRSSAASWLAGTPFDFSRPRKIREEIDLVPGGGYDHNYVLSAHGGCATPSPPRAVAKLVLL
jgi:hypothetical protein